MGQPETPSYKTTVSEQLLYLMGMGGCADIEVLGLPPQKEVPDTAAHKISYVTVSVKSVEHLQGVLVYIRAGDTVPWPGYNYGARGTGSFGL